MLSRTVLVCNCSQLCPIRTRVLRTYANSNKIFRSSEYLLTKNLYDSNLCNSNIFGIHRDRELYRVDCIANFRPCEIRWWTPRHIANSCLHYFGPYFDGCVYYHHHHHHHLISSVSLDASAPNPHFSGVLDLA